MGRGFAEETVAEPFGSFVTVKNTFIDVDGPTLGDDADGLSLHLGVKRQVSEPAPAIARQYSPREVGTVRMDGFSPSSPSWSEDEPEREPPRRHVQNVCGTASTEVGVQHAVAVDTTLHDVDSGASTASCDAAESLLPQTTRWSALEGQDEELPAADELPADWQEAHTVMMRNLPNKYTQQMLLSEINEAGFEGMFDFLYLPIDQETGANRGYAFINFISPHCSWSFKQHYEGCRMNSFNSSKVVSVTPAALQGFQANYAHYSTARVNRGDPSARPLFLRELNDVPKGVPIGAARRGRRRRGGGASAIDLAARRQRQEHGGKQVGGALLAGQDAMAGGHWQGQQMDMWGPHVLVPQGELGEGSGAYRYCPYCGGKAEAHFHFCQFCGASLERTASDTAIQPVFEEFAAAGAPVVPLYYVLVPEYGEEEQGTAMDGFLFS